MITSTIHPPSRRQILFSTLVSVASAALVPEVCTVAALPQPVPVKERPSTTENQNRTSLHQENTYKVAPQRIYNILLDSRQFTLFSGSPAEIDSKAGGAFSMFGGLIVGRNVELIASQRIVQAWRPTHWESGIYSIVKFDLKPRESDTVVVLDHSSFPIGDFDHFTEGWNSHYWEPLKKYLAQ